MLTKNNIDNYTYLSSISFFFKTSILSINIKIIKEVNETNENKKGFKIPDGCLFIPNCGWDWISAAQKFTDANIMGISKNAIIPMMADTKAALCL